MDKSRSRTRYGQDKVRTRTKYGQDKKGQGKDKKSIRTRSRKRTGKGKV
jgi:hypothetical protein